MNPMTNVKNIKKLSELELKQGNSKSSWHDQYKDSAWLFVGGLPYDLTEGDVICVFSQYGEVVNINLVRDKASGKSRGFCFLCYEDQRSTVLAVDNFNGIKLLGRTIRVDHVSDYKAPKDSDKLDDETRRLHAEGCAPKIIEETEKEEVVFLKTVKKEKKDKPKLKVKKEKKHKKRKKKTKVEVSSSSSSSDSGSESDSSDSDDRRKKRSKGKHSSKKSKKKPQNSSSSSESANEEEVKVSAKSKREQLEEKIRVLEQALHSVKNASRKQKSSTKNISDNDRPSGSASDRDRGEFKYRADNERRNDSRDRSSRSDGHRSRESGGRSEDTNETWQRDRSSERSRHEEHGRDRDYLDPDKRKKYNGDHDKRHERDRHRDRSHDRYRR